MLCHDLLTDPGRCCGTTTGRVWHHSGAKHFLLWKCLGLGRFGRQICVLLQGESISWDCSEAISDRLAAPQVTPSTTWWMAAWKHPSVHFRHLPSLVPLPRLGTKLLCGQRCDSEHTGAQEMRCQSGSFKPGPTNCPQIATVPWTQQTSTEQSVRIGMET